MTDELQERLGKAAVVIRRLKERIAALEQGAGPVVGAGPIAIVGAGCRFPGAADGLADYWALLAEGRDGVVPLAERWARVGEVAAEELPRWAGLLATVDEFDAEFFGVSPREAASLDPQQRLLLEVGWEALEDAGIPPHTLAGTRTGVFVGACVSDYGRLVADRRGDDPDAYVVTGNLLSVAAGAQAVRDGGAANDPRLPVVASFSILGDIVREVGGDDVRLDVLVGPMRDAHTFEPTPKDARALGGARVLVVNGLGFESWMHRLVEAAGFVVESQPVTLRKERGEPIAGLLVRAQRPAVHH